MVTFTAYSVVAQVSAVLFADTRMPNAHFPCSICTGPEKVERKPPRRAARITKETAENKRPPKLKFYQSTSPETNKKAAIKKQKRQKSNRNKRAEKSREICRFNINKPIHRYMHTLASNNSPIRT